MSDPTFDPKPLDTSRIVPPDEILRLVDLFAENAHQVWAREKLAQGWARGSSQPDAIREDSSLVPFQKLSEEEKQASRSVALETIKVLLSLGYRKQATGNDTILEGGDLDDKSQQILEQFSYPKLGLQEMRRMWDERLPILWYRDARIYRRAVDIALKLGEAFLAFDIAFEGLQVFRGDLRLIQLQALALARTGATRRANGMLDKLRRAGHQDEETLGLLARTHKDTWQLSTDPAERRKHLKMCYDLYLDAYQRNRGYYSGINAAAMGLIYGDKEVAHQLAREVIEICLVTSEHISPDSGEQYWLEATLAEAALILGNLDMAEEYYRRGSEESGMSSVDLSRTRSQARLLLEHITGNPNLLDHCFARIAVFSGPMFDRPGSGAPRFPHTLEPDIRREIHNRLNELNAQVGFSSLACGGDLIFAETLLERGGEVNIVLPFKKEDFKRLSVDLLPGGEWGERFEYVLRNAATVTTLSELSNATDGATYDFCNQTLSGLALLKSRFLGMDVVPLVLWDARRSGGPGGTQSFLDYWTKRRNGQIQVIPLDQFQGSPSLSDATEDVGKANEETMASDSSPNFKQEIKAMIFADIVGYTRLTEVQIPAFVAHFLGGVARLMEELKNPPVHHNTWGDAICCVFDCVADAGVFALNLRDFVSHARWSKWNLPSLQIRIGLHAGPVIPCYDPVLKKMTYNGAHVNRTARIEPIAEEGQIYASESFAALAASDGVAEFTCDYVGTRQLAKRYATLPVFLVRRTV